MSFIGGFFLQVVSHSYSYAPLSKLDNGNDSDSSTRLKRTSSSESRRSQKASSPGELGTPPGASNGGTEETSSLLSDSTGSQSYIGEEEVKNPAQNDSHRIDIRGLAMVKHVKFYQLWLLLGLLTGIGLMTIK